jgi:hypothetical protein
VKHKKFKKLSNAQQLSTLVALLSDFTESYFGDDFVIDQAMATDISYLKGVVDSLDATNKGSLTTHKNIAEQCIALQTKPFNPFF